MGKRKYGGSYGSSKKRRTTRRFKRRSLKRYANKKRLWSPIGKSHVCKFTYVDQVTLNAPVGLASYYTYRANDLFDPDATGIGHQPYGFDQMISFFNHFTVIGSKITVQTTNNLAVPKLFFVRLRSNQSGETNMVIMCEQPGIKYVLLGDYSSSNNIATLSMGFSAKNFFGTKFIRVSFLYRGIVIASL